MFDTVRAFLTECYRRDIVTNGTLLPTGHPKKHSFSASQKKITTIIFDKLKLSGLFENRFVMPASKSKKKIHPKFDYQSQHILEFLE